MPLARKQSLRTSRTAPSLIANQFVSRFIASENTLICSGCVTIDPKRHKVAFIHDAATGINQLPKGRKNIGEDIHAAALRETQEETGLTVTPLPLRAATRATPTEDMLREYVDPEEIKQETTEEEEGWEDVHEDTMASLPGASGLTDWVQHCEPIGITTHLCEETLAHKVIFWYAAQADSTVPPHQDTRENWEQQYELKWVDAREAAKFMTFEADGQAIEKALSDMRRSGHEI